MYQVGRRKRAVAQVRLYKKGEDKIIVNQMDYREYFKFPPHQEIMLAPLKLVGEDKGHQITILVRGGGIKAQAEAARHGLSRALVAFNEEYKKSIKGVGFLTRDSRKKERKKPGLKRARRAPQWSKR
ncbi:MAG: 30S ribosomal protein S9 [bacterium]